jgi:dipeptidase E
MKRKNKTIIAIGGGEIGRPGCRVETLKIDKKIIEAAGKKFPRVLFVPTASSDADGYIKVFKKHFGERLKCKVDVLTIYKNKYTKKELEEKILKTDIIYVGGGNTLKMMKKWRSLGVDKLMKKAHNKGVVMAGLSAGAICWFEDGSSDSNSFYKKKAPLSRVRGLGIESVSFSPHFDVEKKREAHLKKMVKEKSNVALAADNCAAIEIRNNEFRVITSKSGARAYRIYKKNGKIVKREILANDKFIARSKFLNN